jgi:hypothetical protein
LLKPTVYAPGTSIAQFTIPEDLTVQQTSCAVPFRISGTNEYGQTQFGNQVTLPISISGPCSDALGFGSPDFPRLSTIGIKLLEASITEGTYFTPNRTDRVTGRTIGRQWSSTSYGGVQPVDTCNYLWEPYQFRNPNTAIALALGGGASVTVPWGVFNLSPTSNAGPYSLQFANPATFTEGNYNLNFPGGFTVGGGAHTFQATGVYQRPAGRLRDLVAAGAVREPLSRRSLVELLDQVNQLIKGAPPADLSRLFVDVNIAADNDTMGRHLIRCVMDPTNPTFGSYSGNLTNSLFARLLPERTNRTDVSIRFFPREQIRYNHSNSIVDRTFLTFDSFVLLQDVFGNR